MDYFTTEINFLGVTVKKVGCRLETDLHCKPADTHQYLHAQSCQSNVRKGSTAFAQVVRFERICSTEQKLDNHLEKLNQWLVKRGYRKDHVNSEIERIKLVERTVSFNMRQKG